MASPNDKVHSNCLLRLFLDKLGDHEPGLLDKIKENIVPRQVLFLMTLSAKDHKLASFYCREMFMPIAKTFVVKARFPSGISEDDIKTYFQHKYNYTMINNPIYGDCATKVNISNIISLDKPLSNDEEIRITGTKTTYAWEANAHYMSYNNRYFDCQPCISKKTTPIIQITEEGDDLYELDYGWGVKIPPQTGIHVMTISKERIDNDDLMSPGIKYQPVVTPFYDEIPDQYPMDDSKFQQLDEMIEYQIIDNIKNCYVYYPIIPEMYF